MTTSSGVAGWVMLSTTLSFASPARAEDPSKPGEQKPVAIGAHAGIAFPQAFGGGRPGLAPRFGIAPTGALEMSFRRVTDPFSVGGLVAAGLGTGEGCSSPEVARSCQVPLLGLLAGFARYHFVPLRGAEPWVAAGFAGSVLRGPSPGSDGAAQTSTGRGMLDGVSTTELGVELLLGAGTSWRLGPTTSLGLALHGLVGPNLSARETRKYSQGAEDSRSLPSTGVHGIFFASLHLQLHYPN